MPDVGPRPDPDREPGSSRDHDDPPTDDPFALGKDASMLDTLWIVTRIILATLLILLGFALAIGIVFRLT
jgi:hypothetical protein